MKQQSNQEAAPPTAEGPALWRLLQTTAAVMQGVGAGRSTQPSLDRAPGSLRAGTQALAFDVLRHWGCAAALRDRLARRAPAPVVDALLCTALALLARPEDQPYSEFTLVDQAVEAAKRNAEARHQAGFMNACLRRFLRERATLLSAVAADPVACWNHPAWWIERLRRDCPDRWEAVLRADQHPAPMDLRVNLQRSSVHAYLELLAVPGIGAKPIGSGAIRLVDSQPVRALPGFAAGLVSVQSATAQRAAPLLLEGLNEPALRVLDACAAPGGKTAHLLELRPDARVTAIEISAERSCLVGENLARLGLAAEIRVADAAAPSDWWDGRLFDAILLDAPCSASGIVRRHPDVRWLRRATDIPRLAAQQDRLLNALWPLLAPGGRLLFCTCSVFPQEGRDRMEAFCRRRSDVERLAAPGLLLPLGALGQDALEDNASGDADGFFFALLRKRTA